MDLDSDQAISRLGAAKAECSNHRDMSPGDPPELWRRSRDGAAIERTFSFKSFQAAWVRASLLLSALGVQLSLPQEYSSLSIVHGPQEYKRGRS